MGLSEVRGADFTPAVFYLIRKQLKGTPMEGTEQIYVDLAKEYGVDPLLALAINRHESNFCQSYADWYNEKRHNCGGLMNDGGLMECSSWESCLREQFALLKRILAHGATTISQVNFVYAESPAWTGKIEYFYGLYWVELEGL